MLQQYYNINSAAGVHIELGNGRKQLINCCSILVKGNRLTIERKIVSFSEISELKKEFPGSHFCALNLSGKGILQKQTEKLDIIDKKEFNKLFPNAIMEDFYLQNFISGNCSFVSIIRKLEADEHVRLLKEVGLEVLMLSLGPFPLDNILPQLNVYGHQIVFNGYDISFNEEKQWAGVSYLKNHSAVFPLKIESEVIDEKLILAYASAFQLVLKDKIDLIITDSTELSKRLFEVGSAKKLKVKGAVAAMVFFIILLVNFVLLTHLNSANFKLSRKVSQTAQSSVDQKALAAQIEAKESLLHELGWNQDVSKSRLINQLAQVLPEDIKLTQILVNPIDAELSRINKTLSFTDNQILVTGNSVKVIEINEWMARLKIQPWVKNIQMISYSFNNEINLGEFTITIKY